MAATQFAVLEGRNLVKSYSIVAIYDIAYKPLTVQGWDVWRVSKSFCTKAKQEFCTDKGYTGSLVALYGRWYICLTFRPHILIY